MHKNGIMERMLGSTPSSESPIIPQEIPGKNIVVHYWEDFDSGRHLVFEQEVNEHTIQDLLLSMQEKILKSLGKRKDISCLLVRFSNKEGKPKVDMPIVQASQKVNSVAFERFTVCDKDLDEKARLILEERDTFSDKSTTSTAEIEVKRSPKWYMKIICCIKD